MIFSWSAYYLAPKDDIRKAVLGTFAHAVHSLHYMVNTITMPEIGDILIERAKAGLQVGVVANARIASSPAQLESLKRMIDNGVEVTFGDVGVHLQKVVLVDQVLGIVNNDAFVAWGGYNLLERRQLRLNSWEATNIAAACQQWNNHYETTRQQGRSTVAQLSPLFLPPLPGWSGVAHFDIPAVTDNHSEHEDAAPADQGTENGMGTQSEDAEEEEG